MSHAPMAEKDSADELGPDTTPRDASDVGTHAHVRISRPPSWLEPAAATEPPTEAVVIGLPRRNGDYVQGTLPLQLPSSSPYRSPRQRSSAPSTGGSVPGIATAAQIISSFSGKGLRLVESLAEPVGTDSADSLFEAQRTPRSELPDPREWAARLGQAIIEVLDGRRSPSQLLRWTTPEIHRALRTQAGSLAGVLAGTSEASPSRGGGPGRVQVRSVHVCEPESGIAEVSVVLSTPRRSRAMAMRLEGVDGRWRATVVMLA